MDFLVATSTPETVIPVSEQAESSGVPCLLTICPWEQWYYDSSGAAKTFKYSYMYFPRHSGGGQAIGLGVEDRFHQSRRRGLVAQ